MWGIHSDKNWLHLNWTFLSAVGGSLSQREYIYYDWRRQMLVLYGADGGAGRVSCSNDFQRAVTVMCDVVDHSKWDAWWEYEGTYGKVSITCQHVPTFCRVKCPWTAALSSAPWTTLSSHAAIEQEMRGYWASWRLSHALTMSYWVKHLSSLVGFYYFCNNFLTPHSQCA